ncbi:E3 ubiquitin-protein ligase RNF146-A isoform X2 [Cimex lectularius]|nr:E3 ubiquitin-protein ligase RNF146-A isoform X2 [Cimex lectularius]
MAEKFQRVYNTRSKKRSVEAQEKELVTVELSDSEEEKEEDAESKLPDCAICLQSCSHPARLPCRHIFCFLCIKGVALNSRKCPLCRAHIPADYLHNPDILEVPKPAQAAGHGTYKWYYEGRDGWWEYDARTTVDLEQAYQANEDTIEVLLAGSVFIIDFRNMVQLRKVGYGRMRRLKRDKAGLPSKGVAGLRRHRQLPSIPVQSGTNLGARPVEPRIEDYNYTFDNYINEEIENSDDYEVSDNDEDYSFRDSLGHYIEGDIDFEYNGRDCYECLPELDSD